MRVLVAVLFLFPSIVAAQTADMAALRAQIAALEERMRALRGQTTEVACPVIARTLSRGARGEDVRMLQDFLRSEGVFAEVSTGYFGALTEAAVRQWQVRRGVIDPRGDTGGWGIVGPRTRAAIIDRCAERAREAAVVIVTPIATSTETQATSTAATSSEACSDCEPVPNRPPTVFGIDGPDSIEIGMSARFTIIADDPDGDRLLYKMDWGGTTPLDALYALAGFDASSPQNTFTHAFASAGLYVLTATVTDTAGHSSRITKNVRVTPVSTSCESCATSTPIFEPPTDPGDIQVPSGITSCATPWGGIILQTGRTISAANYFRGSVTYTGAAPLMRCVDGRWQKCDSAGQSCVAHRPPATNATMQGLRRYADVVGAGGCGGLGSGVTVQAEPRTLLCANVIHQAPQGRCAYTQETTAVELFCSYNNWAERLTLQ